MRLDRTASLADEGADEQVGIGQSPSLARKPAYGPVGGREADHERLAPCQGRRKRGRNVCAVAAGGSPPGGHEADGLVRAPRLFPY